MGISSVSVVIPAYNASGFIQETLASVLGQTALPAEILVVDDASTDGTADAVREFGRRSPVPVRLLAMGRNSGGPAAPLNRGVREAGGGLIATLDHDDRMEPRRLELQLQCLGGCPDAGLVIGGISVADSGAARAALTRAARRALASLPLGPLGGGCFRIPRSEAYNGLVEHGCYALTCSTFLFPKHVWAECGGFDERARLMCDFHFLQAVTARYPLGFVDAPVVRWEGPPASLYVSAQRRKVHAEQLRVLGRFDRRLLTPQSRRLLRRRLREELLEIAYYLRNQGSYWDSFNGYLKSVVRGGPSLEAVMGLVKLLPHWLRRTVCQTQGAA